MMRMLAYRRQTTQESSPSVQSTETMTVRTGEDMSQLARDVKTELDNRDEKIQATLNMLHDSINKLGEAIKRMKNTHRKRAVSWMISGAA